MPARFRRIVAVAALLGVSACAPAAKPATPTPSPSPAASPPTTLSAFIPYAEKFVEQHRGLKFLHPVSVQLLNDTDFQQKLNASNDTTPQQLQNEASELQALGLIGASVDLGPVETALLNTSVSGFYDPESKHLYVRGVKLTPYVQSVLVHELTHADQDQHFNIYRPQLQKTNDEQWEAFLCLLEGDAVTIQNDYLASLSTSDQNAANQEEFAAAAQIPTDTPPVLLQLLTFPYVAGPPFVKALKSKGQSTLDAAFAHPPTTTQQVLHSQRYFTHDTGSTVGKPPADGSAFDDGILGEQGLDLLLQEAQVNGLSTTQKDQASAAWDGDHYVAWDQTTSQHCMRIVFGARSSADNEILKNALSDYAGAVPNAVIESSAPLTLKTCSA